MSHKLWVSILIVVAVGVFAYFWRSQIIAALTGAGDAITGLTPPNYTTINAPYFPQVGIPLVGYSSVNQA